MRRNAVLVVVALGAMRHACGTDINADGLNAACTRTKDCENGLTCASGVCSPLDGSIPDGGNSASARDGTGAD